MRHRPALRSAQVGDPTGGYENYEFDIPTTTGCDCYGRYLIRVAEMTESLKIVEQRLDRLRP